MSTLTPGYSVVRSPVEGHPASSICLSIVITKATSSSELFAYLYTTTRRHIPDITAAAVRTSNFTSLQFPGLLFFVFQYSKTSSVIRRFINIRCDKSRLVLRKHVPRKQPHKLLLFVIVLISFSIIHS